MTFETSKKGLGVARIELRPQPKERRREYLELVRRHDGQRDGARLPSKE